MKKNEANKNSNMYQRGYQNGINFAYIPDFKSEQDKIDYQEGYMEAKNKE